MLTEEIILSEIQRLPEQLKLEVLRYIKRLKAQRVNDESSRRRPRKAGSAQGKYTLAPDFDAPLEDFEEYM